MAVLERVGRAVLPAAGWRPTAWIGLAGALLIGCWITLREIDALVRGLLDNGRRWALGGLTSPSAVLSPADTVAGWGFLSEQRQTGAFADSVRLWLLTYGLVDLLSVLLLGALLLRWLSVALSGRSRRWRRIFQVMLLLGLVADAAENVLIAWARLPGWPLWALTAVKCLGLGTALVAMVWSGRARVRDAFLRAARAIYVHRFALLTVVPLGLLALAAGGDLLEQVPDVLRTWLDGGPGDYGPAMVTTGALAVVLWLMGHWQQHRFANPLPATPAPDRPWWWTLAPFGFFGAVLAGLIVLRTVVDSGELAPKRLLVWVVLLGLLAGYAYWVRTPRPEPPARAVSPELTTAVIRFGRVLPLLLLSVVALGLLRAYTAVALLAGGEAWFWWGLGWLLIVGTWSVGLALSAGQAPPTWLLTQASTRPATLAIALVVVSFAMLAVIALWPEQVARAGVLVAVQLALAGIAVLLAAATEWQLQLGTPGFFRALGLRRVPAVTMVLVSGLLASGLDSGGQVHAVRVLESDSVQRPGLDALWRQWRDHDDGCRLEVGGRQVRPLVLVAAEGGGIRAATWTALGVDRLAAVPDGCGRAFVSSGASGGSVALTVASAADPGTAAQRVTRLGRQGPLARAAAAMLTRDFAYEVSGIPVSPDRWRDRAALMEDAWVGTPGNADLAEGYLAAVRTDSPTGRLVLNSTSATTGCRALVSQVALRADPGAPEPGRNPCGATLALPGTMDVLACTGDLSRATAGLLTARFPYVTPSGLIHCPGAVVPDHQLVDGGYAENTGVGTIVDLAQRLIPLIRRHNACALGVPETATACVGDQDDAVVLPVLVYFDNGTGMDLSATPGKPTLEVLVPPLTAVKASGALYSTRAQLDRAARVLDPAVVLPDTDSARAVTDGLAPESGFSPVYVQYQQHRPTVAAPLGWVLSDTSLRSLCTAMFEKPSTEVSEVVGYPRLGRFESWVRPGYPLPTTAPVCADVGFSAAAPRGRAG